MRCQVHIYTSDSICRAHQIHFPIPREIAEVDGAKFSVSEKEACGFAVIRIRVRAFVFLLRVGTCGIRLAATWKIGADELIGNRDGRNIQSIDLYLVARLYRSALSLAELFIRREECCRNNAVVRMRLTVIVEMHNRNLLGESQQ